jgi:hypothetical protein
MNTKGTKIVKSLTAGENTEDEPPEAIDECIGGGIAAYHHRDELGVAIHDLIITPQ